MRSKTWKILALCAMALVAVDLATSRAQEQPQQQPGIAQPQPILSYSSDYANFQVPGAPPTESRIGTMQEIEAAGRAFRDATSEETKSKVREKLVELLEKYFDDDMKIRTTELEKVEARVKKLRTLFDKRASKKQEIVDLQVKVLENEADGLGFFNNPTPQGLFRYGTEPMEDLGRMGRDPENPNDPSNRPLKNPGQPRPN